jgi:tetratricopeptide (TPR) repeat protein
MALGVTPMSKKRNPERATSLSEEKTPKAAIQNPASAAIALNWRTISTFFGGLYNLASKLLWISVVGVVVIILVQGVTHHSTVVGLISVPKELVERGYTSNVAAGRLRDAMLKFATDTNTQMKGPEVALHGDLPDIIVPTVGISLDAITSTLHTLFRITRSRTLTGELTIKDKLLWLRLRLDGDELYDSSGGVDRENPDDLFVAAAPKIFEVIRPYFVVVSTTHKDPTNALEVISQYIDRLPETDENVAWLYNLKGNTYKDRKDYNSASAAYIKAYTLNPNFSYAHYNMGVLLNNLGQTEEAIAEYREAIAIDPKYALPHNNLGLILKNHGDTDEAIAEYRKAIAIDPKYGLPHNNLGVVLKDQGHTDEAIAEYRKAIAIDPKLALPQNNLGVVLKDQGYADEAIPEYRKAIAIDPKYASPHTNLGVVLKDQGHTDEAIAEYRKAIAIDPKYAWPHNNLGVVLKDQGQTDEAIAEYRKAIAIDPKSAWPHNNLGVVLKDQGRTDEAIAEFREAIAVDPNYTPAQQNLDAILNRQGKPQSG